MMQSISEKTIENNLLDYLSGYSDFKVKNQVKFSRKRIDIVIKSDVLNEIWAIEIKIRDWKIALRQANLNNVACSHSYVAIWHQYAESALKNIGTFKKLGVGLMVVDNAYRPHIKLHPKKSNYFNRIAYNHIFKTL